MRAQRDRNDWIFRFKIFQMCMQHPKEKIDIVGRLRNFENALVNLFIHECDAQGQFFCNEINSAQSDGELLQKSTQHEENRLGGFNFVFEFEALFKRLRRPDQFEHSIRLPICPFPHLDYFWSKSRAQLLPVQDRKLPKCVNAPLMEDAQNLADLALTVSCREGIRRIRALHALKLNPMFGYVQVNIMTFSVMSSGVETSLNSRGSSE